jgi:concanavalin A-like lectin/glucanase superfamily protein
VTAPLAVVRMGRRLTTPFGRGADTLALRLTPGVDSSTAEVQAYDFLDHQARFDRAAEPAYVVRATRDITVETRVAATYTGTSQPAVVVFPAGSPAGTSRALPVPVSASIRLVRLVTTPAAANFRPDLFWEVTALLGTTAKVLWVLGGERDEIRARVAGTVAQRHLRSATGRSLDLIGTDLGVPRFPPLPYGFDAGTVALYHLDELSGTVAGDVTGQYPGRTGRPGSTIGAVRLGVPGRYGTAFAFDAAGASVNVASNAVFDIAATGSATMECFVRPDPAAVDGQVLSRHAAPGGPGAGWVLWIGAFGRGLPRNPRLTVLDAAGTTVELFADVSLPTDTFTHLAAVVDQTAKEARLYVDGTLRARKPLGNLGAVVNTAQLKIGPVAGGFRGVIDEVRISNVARDGFAPVLGEADEHYRRRLRIFRRWVLPTPANLAAALNELVGEIGGMANPLVVQDANAPLYRGTRLVRIRPSGLLPGEAVDADGRRGAVESETVGTPAGEPAFDPAYLVSYDRSTVDFSPPGPAPANPHLIQAGLIAPLDQLVSLAASESGSSGRLRVAVAYDPAGPGLHPTGRAVLLGHNLIAPGRLAALAHRAGFAFVSRRPTAGVDGAQVYAAAAPGDYFLIDLAPPAAGPTSADVGGPAVTLSLRPPAPSDSTLRWRTVPAGAGRATLTTTGIPGAPAGVTTLQATAPGGLVVEAEVVRNGRRLSAARTLRLGLTDLAATLTVGGDGRIGAPASVASDSSEVFDPQFLVVHNDTARVNYGTDANNHKMQPAVQQLLDGLLAELTRRSVTGKLEIVSAYRPAGDEFATHGRTLTLRHPGLEPGPLAAAAFAAGFSHVERTSTTTGTVIVRQAPGELVVVAGPDNSGLVLEVEEGASLNLSALPGTVTGTARFGWSTGAAGNARARFDNPKLASTGLVGDRAGLVWVQASYQLGDLPAPYTFRVGLRPELDNANTVISKDQYDLILNILNALHPVGTEVITQSIRDHTVEVRSDLGEVNPDFTFPKFRVRSVLPPLRRDKSRG